MNPAKNDAGRSGNRPHSMDFASRHSTPPGDMLDTLALSAVLNFPEAAALARSLGGPLLFADATAARVVGLLLSGGPIDLAGIDARLAWRWLDWADSFVPRIPARPVDPAWALAVVRRLATERAAVMLVPTLRWGADALEHGGRSVGDVRAEVVGAFDAAEGRGVAA